MQNPQVLIINCGSQYTLVIDRVVRDSGRRAKVLGPGEAAKWLLSNTCRAIIISGGYASVYDDDAPTPPRAILGLKNPNGEPLPILAICFGMQWIAHELGGTVKPDPSRREYGRATIRVKQPATVFVDTPPEQVVWASHGDSVTAMPPGFEITATEGDSDAVSAMANENRNIYCVQFHPEVTQTTYGVQMIENFLTAAECDRDWNPGSAVDEIQEAGVEGLQDDVGLCALSGGVDSMTLASTILPVVGKRIRFVTIDGGQLRDGEPEQIKKSVREAGITNYVFVDARDRFETLFADTIDPEVKRGRFKKVYEAILVEQALAFGGRDTRILQGTLAPDRIESGDTGGALIKSHHNVGLKFDGLQEIQLIGGLFKPEVRAIARLMGLPPTVSERQPFPGPGLFIRTVGIPATPYNVAVTRWADAKATSILNRRNLMETISQLVVAYVGAHTVGVKGDQRVHRGAVVVRPFRTIDFMTGEGVHLPEEAVNELKRVIGTHDLVTRVWMDYTDKPPATTEME